MVSSIARFVKILRGGAQASAEILPPGHPMPRRDAERSVEARADAFMSLFLQANPKDLRDSRSGPR